MSRELIVKIRDDLDKVSDAEETVTLTIDGTEYDGTYVIDLSTENANELQEKLSPYLEAAHERVSPKGRSKTSSTKSEKERRNENKLIRTWAKTNGLKIGDKGQVPVEVRQAFERFQPTNETPKESATRYGKRGGEIARLRALPKDVRDEIRAWARENGHEVSSRGFLPAELVKAFEDAHKLRVSA
jgi:hypothetical protein